jgi:AmiR/NasT family two-component response regulator
LNCYSPGTGAFDPETVSALKKHAASLSKILQLAMRLYPAAPYPEHLRTALASRAVVDAAVALIMLQNRCSRDTAIRTLQLAARNSNEHLLVIAQDLLQQVTDLPGRPLSTNPPATGPDSTP